MHDNYISLYTEEYSLISCIFFSYHRLHREQELYWFASSITWDQVRVRNLMVTWNELILFPQAIPHFYKWSHTKPLIGALTLSRLWWAAGNEESLIISRSRHLYGLDKDNRFISTKNKNPDWSITNTMLLSLVVDQLLLHTSFFLFPSML